MTFLRKCLSRRGSNKLRSKFCPPQASCGPVFGGHGPYSVDAQRQSGSPATDRPEIYETPFVNVQQYQDRPKDVIVSKSILLDGKKLAMKIRAGVKEEVTAWVEAGNRPPCLVAILVGDNPASTTYVKNKALAAEKTGITGKTINLPSTISEEELLDLLKSLNEHPDVDGILVQLPLPGHIDERKICNSVVPQKDVDGFHVLNIGRLCRMEPTMLPATPYGVMELIKLTGIETKGKTAVVIGRSRNVGLPIALLLMIPGGDATTTVCNSKTTDKQMMRYIEKADIVVSAVGRPNLITGDMLKEGAVVIDVGITRITDRDTGKSRLVGDVNFESASQKAGYITPVPGGVGPMTVAMLMRNTLTAARREIDYEQ